MRLLIFLLAILLSLIIFTLVVFLIILEPADRRLLTSPTKRMTINESRRTYRLYNADKDNPNPLLISLHGYRDRAGWHALYSGVHLLADETDMTLALPSGMHQSWNGTFCCGWAYANNINDVAFIEAMIEDIVKDHAIDTSRIYVVGFSNGGILAQQLLVKRPDLFAAGASVMSGVGEADNMLDITDARAPIILINGTRDIYVPLDEPKDTKDFTFLPAFKSADIWANHYGLQDRQKSSKENYTEYTWATDKDGKLVHRIYDTMHRWPDWRLWTLPGDTPQATQEIGTFLRRHEL